MGEKPRHNTRVPDENEDRLEAALKPFGWACGPEFWKRYYTDPWVFNLANAVARLSEQLDNAQLRSIEARNPGIDMDEVRRIRAGQSGASGDTPERPIGAE